MIKLPERVKFIIDKLYENGYEAFAVGGCIRDVLIGRKPKDWDITTSASPKQVKEIFRKTIDTGIEHGTVTVMLGGEGFEVTTYRIDGEYEDSRHPKEVIFTSNLVEDLKRRDFTINAMAYNDIQGLVDVFDGRNDIENKIIRCVGAPVERFSEDALRIMRAVRFSAQLDFEIESDTLVAMKELAGNLANISAERVKTEFDKMLLSAHPDRLLVMANSDIMRVVLPEFDEMLKTSQENPNHIYNVGIHTVKAVKMLDTDYDSEKVKELDELLDFGILENEKVRLMLKWTMLLHDIGKPKMKTIDDKGVAHFKMHEVLSEKMAKDIFKRLKFDNYTSDTALRLIKWHDYRFSASDKSVRKAVSKIGSEYMGMLFLVKRADMLAQNPETFEEKCESLIETYRQFQNIKRNEDCLCIKDLKVNGKDLIEAGIKSGPVMGQIMEYLLEKVLEHPADNEKGKLISYAVSYVNDIKK